MYDNQDMYTGVTPKELAECLMRAIEQYKVIKFTYAEPNRWGYTIESTKFITIDCNKVQDTLFVNAYVNMDTRDIRLFLSVDSSNHPVFVNNLIVKCDKRSEHNMTESQEKVLQYFRTIGLAR